MKNNGGFTLLQLLFVIAIIGIITASISTISLNGVNLYSWYYSKDISGKLDSVTSAMPPGGIVNTTSSVFQAGVVIKQSDGSYITFTTDDRQWAAFIGDKVNGKCVTARVYPYAPWELSKAGTYYAGRLLNTSDC